MATITVPDETRRKQAVVGGTPQTSFTFDWVIFDETTDIRLWNGTTELTIVTDFTVAGTAGSDGGFDGGTITMAGAFVAGLSNVTVTIQGNTALDRATNLAATGPLDIDLLNKDLNRFVTILQQIDDKYDRTIQFPETTSLSLPVTFPESSAGNEIIAWDAAGTALEIVGVATLGALTLPASSLDNAIARYNGTTGDALQDSAATIDDNDLLTAPGGFAGAKGADIASAATVVIGTDGDRFDITGTTTITGFTVAIGRQFTLQFDGAVLLTNGASLVLPGAANITTSAGDRFTFVATAADTVECISMAPVAGFVSLTSANSWSGTQTMTSKPIEFAEGANVASASEADVWGPDDGQTVHITGTTTITSFGTAPQAGAIRFVIFDGALTLTHNGTSLILPGAANITTAAGDSCIVYADSTANMRILNYTVAATAPGGGGGAMTFLGSATASSSATLDFESMITSSYNSYMVTFDSLVPATDGAVLDLVLSTDNGSSYISTNYFWVVPVTYFIGGSGNGGNNESQSDSTIQLSSAQGNDGDSGVTGVMYLSSVQNATMRTTVVMQGFGEESSNIGSAWNSWGGQLTVGAHNAFRLQYSTGSIATGTVRLYGISES